ncbi:hypothetical protein EZ55_04331 (plasmid) [Alteromonas macleodii]|nr:hypothetical protein ALT831_04211 [Alteromonas macleodii]CAI3970713.1 hypothetical protein ALTBGP6_04178 [Alteromonas macleodii]CAI3970715.1 hypothetical protein ALTBGP14_04177 [Alteromonas macleodii]CAI3970961.1 hypothetical protein ALTBGP9_04166 [Alteromonas macleodii]CAI3970996.1 hypothetical protein EZ55_04331 [Alteromonas macleodii]
MVSLILISVSNLCEPNPFALGVLSGGFVFYSRQITSSNSPFRQNPSDFFPLGVMRSM